LGFDGNNSWCEVGEHHFWIQPHSNCSLLTVSRRTMRSTTLKSKHFLRDSSSLTPITLLATKYRTKKSFLAGFTALHIFVVTLRCDHSCLYCQVSRVSESEQVRHDL
jgi:hypothetical protein